MDLLDRTVNQGNLRMLVNAKLMQCECRLGERKRKREHGETSEDASRRGRREFECSNLETSVRKHQFNYLSDDDRLYFQPELSSLFYLGLKESGKFATITQRQVPRQLSDLISQLGATRDT